MLKPELSSVTVDDWEGSTMRRKVSNMQTEMTIHRLNSVIGCTQRMKIRRTGLGRYQLTVAAETLRCPGITCPRTKHPNVAAACIDLQSDTLLGRSYRGVDIIKAFADCITQND
jgi:hypothetical protein